MATLNKGDNDVVVVVVVVVIIIIIIIWGYEKCIKILVQKSESMR